MEQEITEKQLNMRGKFGEYLSSNFGISPMAAITVIIGCAGVYVLLVKLRLWRSPSKRTRMIVSSKSYAELYGGGLAWRILNNYKAALANITKTNNTFSNQKDLLLLKDLRDVDEQHLDLNNLQKQEKAEEAEILKRSKSIAGLYGGDLAWRRLDEYHVATAIPDVLRYSNLVLRGLLEEHHLDLNKLQIVTARLEMAGEEEEGVKILKEAKKKNEESDKSHHVYEIEMLLAELLIYMGKYDEAQKCNCLHEKIMQLDARRPLFKAIIYGMQENWEKSEHFWDKFMYLRQEILTAIGQEEHLPDIRDFNAFKQKVQHLQFEIQQKKNINIPATKKYDNDI